MPKQLAKVVKVIDEYRVVINQGKRDEISVGDRYLVLNIGEEIFDPDTNESLGEVEIIKGKGKVTHVQEKMSTLESFGTERIKRRGPRGLLATATATGFYDEYDDVQKTFDNPELGDVAKKLN